MCIITFGRYELESIRYRTELKYLINTKEFITLRSGISAIFKRDSNSLAQGGYRIRSLYFDDVFNTDYFTKLSGTLDRKKYRVRFYNNDSSFIRMEKKVKKNLSSYKLSAPLTKEQTLRMVEGDFEFMKDSPYPLLREIYIYNSSRLLRPSVITDYYREAFVFEPMNVRITFDEDLRTGLLSDDLFNPDAALIPVTGKHQTILEVKYDATLPDIAKQVLSCVDKTVMSISKFTACKRYMALNSWEVEKWG
ncbi:MAG: polyphosphate polymerase domain-containing protein [Eubacteriaceae bacterium]|nr:polyphosphate polymerase domain-containing protein [Eubacteriaceae bacterium]